MKIALLIAVGFEMSSERTYPDVFLVLVIIISGQIYSVLESQHAIASS